MPYFCRTSAEQRQRKVDIILILLASPTGTALIYTKQILMMANRIIGAH